MVNGKADGWEARASVEREKARKACSDPGTLKVLAAALARDLAVFRCGKPLIPR